MFGEINQWKLQRNFNPWLICAAVMRSLIHPMTDTVATNPELVKGVKVVRLSVSVYLLVVLFHLLACSSTQAVSQSSSADQRQPVLYESSTGSPRSPATANRGMANPAARACVEAGYRLEPVVRNGVPVSELCINDRNSAVCDSWAYFRRECLLR